MHFFRYKFLQDILGRRTDSRMENSSASGYGGGRPAATEPHQQIARANTNFSAPNRTSSPDQQVQICINAVGLCFC